MSTSLSRLLARFGNTPPAWLPRPRRCPAWRGSESGKKVHPSTHRWKNVPQRVQTCALNIKKLERTCPKLRSLWATESSDWGWIWIPPVRGRAGNRDGSVVLGSVQLYQPGPFIYLSESIYLSIYLDLLFVPYFVLPLFISLFPYFLPSFLPSFLLSFFPSFFISFFIDPI